MTVAVLKSTGQVLCNMSLKLELSAVFSWPHNNYGLLARRSRWNVILTTSYQGHILSIWLINKSLDYLAQVRYARFLPYNITCLHWHPHPAPAHVRYSGRKSLSTVHIQGIGVLSSTLSIYINYLEVLLKGKLSFSPVIYSITYQYELIDTYFAHYVI